MPSCGIKFHTTRKSNQRELNLSEAIAIALIHCAHKHSIFNFQSTNPNKTQLLKLIEITIQIHLTSYSWSPFSRNALTAPGSLSIASRSGGEDAPTLPFHRALSAQRSLKVGGQSLQTRLKLHRDSDISNANSSRILENLAKTWQEPGNGSATKAAQGV